MTNVIYQLSSLADGAYTYLDMGHKGGTVEQSLEESLEYRVAVEPQGGRKSSHLHQP